MPIIDQSDVYTHVFSVFDEYKVFYYLLTKWFLIYLSFFASHCHIYIYDEFKKMKLLTLHAHDDWQSLLLQ